ncbi:hypothetical protein CC80DRAFT_546440 [Byssothecium circinans]|uniref:Uncharacterized protein n=1 Tax=Byssothecium circinans TaxID=147558 RepID=A0A6A5U1P2_9PLEO|nr:hypothetical protein CC80DRAFT_546440 [Byssothecium circinans]
MKEISDLPAEIFAMVVNELVSDVGVAAAWKLRGVSRLFASEIEHNIFAKQPDSIVYDLAPQVMALLPNKINKMVTYLAEKLGLQGKEKDRCLESLCRSVTGCIQPRYPNRVLKFEEWSRNISLNQLLTPRDKLSGAAAIGSVELVKQFIKQVGMDGGSPLFSSIIGSAIYAGQSEILTTIAENKLATTSSGPVQANINTFKRSNGKRMHNDLQHLLRHAMEKDHLDTVRALLLLQEKHLSKMNWRDFHDLLTCAVQTMNYRMVEHMMSLSIPGRVLSKVDMRSFRAACSLPDIRIFNALMSKDNGGIDVHLPRLTWTPLNCAIRLGTLEMVQAVLDAGADVDQVGTQVQGFGQPRAITRPIQWAIRRRDEDMIRLLIAKGAASVGLRFALIKSPSTSW